MANNFIIYLSQVGVGDDENLQCHTDLHTCCSGTQGPHRGDWYFPNGTVLPFSTPGRIYEMRGDRVVKLIHGESSNSSPFGGVYRCDIPTSDVHDDNDASVRVSIYVELRGESQKSMFIILFQINGIHDQYLSTVILDRSNIFYRRVSRGGEWWHTVAQDSGGHNSLQIML